MRNKVTPEVFNESLRQKGRFYEANPCWGNEWVVVVNNDNGLEEGPWVLVGSGVGTFDEHWLMYWVTQVHEYPGAYVHNPHDDEQLTGENITVTADYVALGGLLYKCVPAREIDPGQVTFLTEGQLAVLEDRAATTPNGCERNPARA